MLKIINGEVYDPLNGIDGEIRDICFDNGKIVSEAPPDCDVIDAAGMIVMPGGVELHAHVAGPKVNAGRKMRPEDHRRIVIPRTPVTRSGTGHTVPSTFATGYHFAGLGYTTLMEAAGPPLEARHVHEEMNDIPILDKAFFLMMGNNYFVMKFIHEGEFSKLKDYVAWLLEAAGAYVIKLVNPAGVDRWKWGKNVHTLEDPADTFPVSPKQVLVNLARVQQELGIPHPIHVHCNNLGTPGNAETTLQTMKAVGDMPIHITHIQFNGFGKSEKNHYRSGAPELAEYVNKHNNVTVDMGQIVFGPATTMTADGPWQYRLHQLTHDKWINVDLEMEGGSGIVPYVYKKNNPVNAVQWTVALEFALLMDDPWRVYLTTDHPNGGPFHAYPDIIKLLMSRDYRAEILEGLHKRAKSYSTLKDIDREYSLYEIAVITRAGPAKVLGLKEKGHLGPGADADIAIYPKNDDPKEMFANPRYVIKGGEMVAQNGKIVLDKPGTTFYVTPGYDQQIEDAIRDDFESFYTICFENYPVQVEHYIPHRKIIPCEPK
jgi:formylmethanofuran dehydrogenase subunit A